MSRTTGVDDKLRKQTCPHSTEDSSDWSQPTSTSSSSCNCPPRGELTHLLNNKGGVRRRMVEPGGTVTEPDAGLAGAGGGGGAGRSSRKKRGFFNWLRRVFNGETELRPREFRLGHPTTTQFTPNVILNQKYNVITFFPLVMYQQFKFFLNLFFLVMATSQFFKDVQIGYWYTYWGPLIFVLSVTCIREAVDDVRRRQRDKEINSQKYQRITRSEPCFIPSSAIKVGDLIIVEKDQRVPADMILLRTSDRNGRCFIRTDQLDGETDWKLRLPILQDVENDRDLLRQDVSIYAERPQKDIHSFIGTLSKETRDENGRVAEMEETGILLENTLWANCVISAGNAVGVVVYTGRETRSVMNNSRPRSKVGLTDLEINDLTKILFMAVVGLAFLMMCLKGFEGPWPRYMFRFVLLFSYIIPISIRVNMDLAKMYYSWSIQNDEKVRGTVVRSTTIPEDLGRISYLLTDKTGTLTQNEMVFRRLCLGPSTWDSPAHIRPLLQEGLRGSNVETVQRMNEVSRATEAVKALAICHNVTPVTESSVEVEEDPEMDFGVETQVMYQASSPDEIALVKWAMDAGLSLRRRDQGSMTLSATDLGLQLHITILHIFPFTSELKRMGIIVKEGEELTFYLKGADVVMKNVVRYNDWLEEAVGNMAREGLRTLVVAKRKLDLGTYEEFERKYALAKSSKSDRANLMTEVMRSLEKDMELIGVTGVEDTLQQDVNFTLETLRNAGIKIWMLTGDKLETAICIAKSSKLVSSQQEVFVFEERPPESDMTERAWAFAQLNAYSRRNECPLIIKGESLEVCLESYQKEFMELACSSPAVVVCRCSPTQKAQVVTLVQEVTGKRAAAIGDGGNDVAMIQAADAGIGIEGKEGRQASLAADFSITQFSFVAPLLLVHGRYCYKRSAALAQFVMHRGLIITVMQAVFSSIFYFSSVALYQGFLMIGYATVYTMFPVFALVLDQDVKEGDLMRLPELYSELGKGRSLTYKTFFLWVLISVFQGSVIMYGSLILFQDEFIHIVSISFTSLILTELIMVALTIRNMHHLMLVAELISLIFYFGTLFVFYQFFDSSFIFSFAFIWKVCLITTLSCLPIYLAKFVRKWVSPPTYSKL